jgi:hypothetical protein
MNVAQWYAAPSSFSVSSSPWTIHAGANPGMNAAKWYLPAESGSSDALCEATDFGCP